MAKGKETLGFVLSVGITGGLLFFGAQYTQKYFSGEGNNTSVTNGVSFSGGIQTQTSFVDVEGVSQRLFSYGGSTIWASIWGEVDGMIPLVKLVFELRYTDPTVKPRGSGTGIKMLLNGQLALAQSSRPLKSENYGLAIAVRPELPISGLTVTQLQDIHLSKITN
ncbi:MAG: hypothetical protein HC799_17625 [Limnothrix sp. RL_2_0]|nr:hypothetical protein [Limnothrix sp. RL_2_0]